jgi:hypothetical protein
MRLSGVGLRIDCDRCKHCDRGRRKGVTATGRPSWGITMENYNNHIGFRALISRNWHCQNPSKVAIQYQRKIKSWTVAEPILLDTNILTDISRGNQQVADALNRYVKSGTPVYISRAAYDELVTRAPTAQMRGQYREMLADMRIQIAPSGPLTDGSSSTPTTSIIRRRRTSRGRSGIMTAKATRQDRETPLSPRKPRRSMRDYGLSMVISPNALRTSASRRRPNVISRAPAGGRIR